MKKGKKVVALALATGIIFSNVNGAFASSQSEIETLINSLNETSKAITQTIKEAENDNSSNGDSNIIEFNDDNLVDEDVTDEEIEELIDILNKNNDIIRKLLEEAISELTPEEIDVLLNSVGDSNLLIKEMLLDAKNNEEPTVDELEVLINSIEENNKQISEIIKQVENDDNSDSKLLDELSTNIDERAVLVNTLAVSAGLREEKSDDKNEETSDDENKDKKSKDDDKSDDESKLIDVSKLRQLPDGINLDNVKNGDTIHTNEVPDGEVKVGEWEVKDTNFNEDTKEGELILPEIESNKEIGQLDLMIQIDCNGAGALSENVIKEAKAVIELLNKQDPDSKVWIGDLHDEFAAGPMSIEQAKTAMGFFAEEGKVFDNEKVYPYYQEQGIPSAQYTNILDYYTPVVGNPTLAVISDGADYSTSLASSNPSTNFSRQKDFDSDANNNFIPIYVGGNSYNDSTSVIQQFSSHKNYMDLSAVSDENLATDIQNKLDEIKPFKINLADVNVKLISRGDVELSEASLVDSNGKEYPLEINEGNVDMTITPEVEGAFTLKYKISGKNEAGDSGIDITLTSGDKSVSDSIDLDQSKNETKVRKSTQEIGFKILFVADDSLNKGEMKTVTEGSYGIREIVSEMESKDGVDNEESIKEISNEIVKDPVDEVIHVGTYVEPEVKPEPKPEPEPTPTPDPTIITQGGDEQVIIVNKDKFDKIDINNSDTEEIINNLCKKTEEIDEKLKKVEEQRCGEESKKEEIKKPLEKPMQDTGVFNAVSDVSVAKFGIMSLLGFMSTILGKRKK